MIYQLNIRLTTAFVGSRKLNENNVRQIARVNDKDVKLFTKRIRELCYKYATEDLNLWDYSYDSIKIDGVLKVHPEDDKPITHTRKFFIKDINGEKEESFEAYGVGTRMSFCVYVPNNSSILTQQNIEALFTYIGQFDGISQFGLNWGYGKYQIESIEKLDASSIITQ